jgi:hypothetical protein
MRSNRPLGVLLFVLMLFAVLPPSHLSAVAQGLPAESFDLGPEPGLGYFGIQTTPDWELRASSSYLTGFNTTGESVNQVWQCSALSDLNCASANYWHAEPVWMSCTSELDTNCIVSLSATDSEGNSLEVKGVGSFPGALPPDFKGNADLKLPNGGPAPVYEIPGAPHASGDKYVVKLSSFASYDRNTDTTFHTSNFALGIFAVDLIKGNYPIFSPSTNRNSYFNRQWRSNFSSKSSNCVLNDSQSCALSESIPLDTTFSVTLRTNIDLPNWYHGRITKPAISVATPSKGSVEVSITARAISVPVLSIWKKKTQIGSEFINFVNSLPKPLGGTGSGAGNFKAQNGDPNLWSLRFDPTQYDQSAMDLFLHWLPETNNTATTSPTYWMIRAEDGVLGSQHCQAKSGILGIVSSNASQYLSGPPVWNAVTRSLDYKVAAPHFLNDGSITQGTYDLAIDSSYARCIYGFSNAPVKATVSIIADSGEKQVAVTSLTESNGWMYFSANGFTFSSPTISIKLSQQAESPTPDPSATPSLSVAASQIHSPAASTSKPGGNKASSIKTNLPGAKNQSVKCLSMAEVVKAFKLKKCPKGFTPFHR